MKKLFAFITFLIVMSPLRLYSVTGPYPNVQFRTHDAPPYWENWAEPLGWIPNTTR